MQFKPLQFLDLPVEPIFDVPPARLKTPGCPNGFVWQGHTYRVLELLSEWHDFARRGRSARNMPPAHAQVAARRGSLGVGRFYFRVRVDSDQFFDLYYDRAPQVADRKKDHWFLYREIRNY